MQKNKSPQSNDNIQALIDNGLEFLSKARVEMEAKHYKHSIVSFWTAVEILLKVPLVNEHWTLACTRKVNKPNKKAYLNGDFQSVTYDETRDLFRDVLEKPITKTTHEAFDKVRKHRNRVVHFYHSSFTDTELESILKEQADAWFALNRLIREEWVSVFEGKYQNMLALMETRLLQGSKFYAALRLEQVKPLLDKLTNEGNEISNCTDCEQQSVYQEIIKAGDCTTSKLIISTCAVCTATHRHVHLHCTSCGGVISVPDGELGVNCPHCQTFFERYDLIDDFNSYSEPDHEYLPGGCTNCANQYSVAKFGDNYICTQCLTLFEKMMVCGCCDHCSDHVPDMSFFRGCDFCDGDPKYANNDWE